MNTSSYVIHMELPDGARARPPFASRSFHAPEVSAANERKVLISLVLIATFMVVEVAGGLISGSLALIADAGHMLTDAAALALAYVAFRLGRRALTSAAPSAMRGSRS